MKADIVSIKLKVGEREIELTEEEARSAYKKLHEVFAEKETHFIPYFHIIEREPRELPAITWTSPGTGIRWTGTDPYYPSQTTTYCGVS